MIEYKLTVDFENLEHKESSLVGRAIAYTYSGEVVAGKWRKITIDGIPVHHLEIQPGICLSENAIHKFALIPYALINEVSENVKRRK